MQLVTLEELTSNWYTATTDITKEELIELDWDELLTNLNIYCPEAEGKNVVISDFDTTTYHNVAVSFQLNT